MINSPAELMLTLRQASLADLDELVRIDREDEGGSSTFMDDWGAEAAAEHQNKIAAFVLDHDRAAWVLEEAVTARVAGVILWRYRNRLHEMFEEWSVISQLSTQLFPSDGAFSEIYQLWIAPDYRRLGWGSRLKQKAEEVSRHRGVKLLYTHTEAHNTSVIAMNLKLGYREVRRGPIWDQVVRVSLIKSLA